jgi:hypothetical protein
VFDGISIPRKYNDFMKRRGETKKISKKDGEL